VNVSTPNSPNERMLSLDGRFDRIARSVRESEIVYLNDIGTISYVDKPQGSSNMRLPHSI
jgi:hypothetical protein